MESTKKIKYSSGSETYKMKDMYSYTGDMKDGIINDSSGSGTYKMEDVYSYTGDMKDGIPYGVGTIRYHETDRKKLSDWSFFCYSLDAGNRVEYKGAVELCHPEGKGTMKFTNGVYTGSWHAGKPHGYGTLTNSKGAVIYEGEWVEGRKHGKGTYTSSHGNECDGEWFEGRPLKGSTFVITYPNGNVYKGSVSLDIILGYAPHGYGKLHAKNWGKLENMDIIYEGEFFEGYIHGKGKMTCKGKGFMNLKTKTQIMNQGDVYEGQFIYNRFSAIPGYFHGEGKMTYANDDVYKGSFVENLPRGKGKKTCANGDVYDGEWRNGKEYGYFNVFYQDGSRYFGYLKNNKPDGRGILITHDKTHDKTTVYDGYWQNGNYKGAVGILKDSNKKEEAKEEDKNSLEVQQNQLGESQFKPSEYKGDKAKDGRPHGKGEVVFSYRDKFNTYYRYGKDRSYGPDVYPVQNMHDIRNNQSFGGETQYEYYLSLLQDPYRKYQIRDDIGYPIKYIGSWHFGSEHGEGTKTYNDGTTHCGNWEMGHASGYGKITYPDKTYYDGDWNKDKPDGKGIMTFPDGRTYFGSFKNGTLHGEGIVISGNKIIQNGIWENNEYQSKANILPLSTEEEKKSDTKTADMGTQTELLVQNTLVPTEEEKKSDALAFLNQSTVHAKNGNPESSGFSISGVLQKNALESDSKLETQDETKKNTSTKVRTSSEIRTAY